MTIPIALLMGFYLRVLRPGKVLEVSGIGVALLLLAIVAGDWVQRSTWADAFTLTPQQLVIALVVYGFVASVLPVWMLLAPRDYLSTFMKIGAIALLAIGVVFTAPTLQNQAITKFASTGTGPVFSGSLFPFVFITIACGALSGFHALISSGTTPKMIQKESQIRLIGYGGMLMESSVAVMALIAASLLDPGLYYAMNSPAGLLGSTATSASQAVANLGFTITPDQLSAAAAAVQEKTLIARTGGAPTLAVGMSHVLSEFLGGDALKAFWYHFAIMFEALFILTTVDAGTRVGRFMLQDTLGNVYKPFARTNWKPGLWSCSAIVVLAWGYFLWVGVGDPLGGINQLFPLFGIANQLLAAVALTVGTVILVRSGKLKYAWVTGLPLAWDAAVTLTASYQKVFSSDPKLGFFAQRDRYQTALDAGKVLAPAKSPDQMHQIVTNSTVDGVLAAFFALMVIVVLVNALVVCIRAIRSGSTEASAEAPFVESALTAPAGLFPTAQERRELARSGGGDRGSGR
jgi:carbon starvation protein